MSRYNLQIAVGSYVGDGVSGLAVNCGFSPTFLWIRGRGLRRMIWWTHHMLPQNKAISVSESAAALTSVILSRLNNGFTVSANANVNTSGETFDYVAIRGLSAQQIFRNVTYIGNAADDRNITFPTVGFTPDIAFTSDGAAQTGLRFPFQVGDVSGSWGSSLNQANLIQSFLANGMQVGSNNVVNRNTTTFFASFLKTFPGVIGAVQYTGNGLADRQITFGFQPDVILFSRAGGSKILLLSLVAGTFTVVSDASAQLTGRNYTLNSSGIIVQGSDNLNTNTLQYDAIAFKAGNHIIPPTRLAS